MSTKFEVSDMNCAHCAQTITKAIGGVDSAAVVEIDIETKIIDIRGFQNLGIIEKSIQDAGYTPRLISRESP